MSPRNSESTAVHAPQRRWLHRLDSFRRRRYPKPSPLALRGCVLRHTVHPKILGCRRPEWGVSRVRTRGFQNHWLHRPHSLHRRRSTHLNHTILNPIYPQNSELAVRAGLHRELSLRGRRHLLPSTLNPQRCTPTCDTTETAAGETRRR